MYRVPTKDLFIKSLKNSPYTNKTFKKKIWYEMSCSLYNICIKNRFELFCERKLKTRI